MGRRALNHTGGRHPVRRHRSLRTALVEMGLSQREAARQLGISEAHVSNILSRRHRPSLRLAIRIEKLFNVDPSVLV